MDVSTNFVAKHDKFVKYLDMTIEHVEPDYCRVSMPITGHHLNGMQVAHGGVIAALVDVVFGAAANDGRKYGVVTLSSSVDYLMPGKTSPLIAEARAVRIGGHILNYAIEIHDGDGTLVARAMVTGYASHIPLPE